MQKAITSSKEPNSLYMSLKAKKKNIKNQNSTLSQTIDPIFYSPFGCNNHCPENEK